MYNRYLHVYMYVYAYIENSVPILGAARCLPRGMRRVWKELRAEWLGDFGEGGGSGKEG
jgi:hypothetical protein